jgi:predicted RNA-binding protein YlqC (UPF0109 family)
VELASLDKVLPQKNLNPPCCDMKDFIGYLIKNLVDQPDAVDIQVSEGEQGIKVEIRVSPEDVAKIVGRQGRTI